jgi:membrane protein YdbS with pleckstrin-like domain
MSTYRGRLIVVSICLVIAITATLVIVFSGDGWPLIAVGLISILVLTVAMVNVLRSRR